MTQTDAPAPRIAATRLVVRTEPVDELAPLIPRADPRHPLLWMRRGEGIVGLGETLRIETSGASRVEDAAAAWTSIAAAADVDDRVGLPAPDSWRSAPSPSPTTPRRRACSWCPSSCSAAATVAPGSRASRSPRSTTPSMQRMPRHPSSSRSPSRRRSAACPGWRSRRAPCRPSSTRRRSPRPCAGSTTASSRRSCSPASSSASCTRRTACAPSINRLAEDYPDTWVYAVDGLIGASPETLVRVDHGTVSARVLAGTTARGAGEASDRERAAALVGVAEGPRRARPRRGERRESPRARTPPASMRAPSRSPCSCRTSGTSPPTSRARSATARARSTSCRRCTRPPRSPARPAASRCGCSRSSRASTAVATPAPSAGSTATATANGPSRCGARRSDPDGTIAAYAGCGIVHDSEPADELAETVMKFRPIVEAFGG